MVNGARIIQYCKKRYGKEWKDYYEETLAGVQKIQREQIRKDKECNSDMAIKLYDEFMKGDINAKL